MTCMGLSALSIISPLARSCYELDDFQLVCLLETSQYSFTILLTHIAAKLFWRVLIPERALNLHSSKSNPLILRKDPADGGI